MTIARYSMKYDLRLKQAALRLPEVRPRGAAV
jgi:hypothetical protein